jgi:prepilin-type N-terminal cleavage/methylation domain-containing protein
MIMRSKQSGFTLVEIAIVLVIIGLLLGGVLKGQELINSAKVKNLATDFRNMSTFVYAYQDKYRAIPGDDRSALAHLGAPAVCAGTDTTCAVPAPATVGDGRINGWWISTAITEESFVFWQHVRLANLSTGTTALPASIAAAGDYIPRNAEGGIMGISGTTPITGWTGNFFICSAGIQGRFVRQLDTMLDDGVSTTGTIRAVVNLAAAAQAAGTSVTTADDATLFSVCQSF